MVSVSIYLSASLEWKMHVFGVEIQLKDLSVCMNSNIPPSKQSTSVDIVMKNIRMTDQPSLHQ